MKYSVLLKPKVMLRIDGIEAGSQKEAALKALAQYESNAHDLMQRDLHNYNPKDPGGTFRYMEFADGEVVMEALVDEEGDEDYDNSEWYIITDDCPESVIVDKPEIDKEYHELLAKHKKLQNG